MIEVAVEKVYKTESFCLETTGSDEYSLDFCDYNGNVSQLVLAEEELEELYYLLLAWREASEQD